MNTEYLAVLDYSTNEIYIYNISPVIDVEVFLEEHHFNLDEIYYMISDSLLINLLNA